MTDPNDSPDKKLPSRPFLKQLKQTLGSPASASTTGQTGTGLSFQGIIPTLALSSNSTSTQRQTFNPASSVQGGGVPPNRSTNTQQGSSVSNSNAVLGKTGILTTARSRTDALSDVVLVSRTDRAALMLKPKDWNDYMTHMITPTLNKKFDTIDLSGLTDSSSIISNSASVSELLADVEKHVTRYNLVHLFTEFPVLDNSKHPDDPRRWWDDRRTIDLFRETDWIDKSEVAYTVSWMRRHLDDDQVTKELNWTSEYLVECCEDSVGGPSCFKSVVSGEIHQFQAHDNCQYGGPLTLMIILTHIRSSSERAILRLGAVVKDMKIRDQRGENINLICNQLMYVLQRLEKTTLPPDLVSDLFSLFQTSSHPDFNEVFKSWKHLYTLKLCAEPTWMDLLDRARACYDGMIEDWNVSSPPGQDRVGAFNAQTQVPPPPPGRDRNCHHCGQPGHLQADCPKLKAGSTWFTDPPSMRPNSKRGDTFTMGSDGRKNWSKLLQMPDGSTTLAKWCGRCQNTKWKRKGTWTTGSTSHFTSTCPHAKGTPQANLAASGGSASSAPSGGGGNGSTDSTRTFSQVLQGFQDAASGAGGQSS